MKVVFRVDSSSVIGIGHITRCMVLAEFLRENGAKILFICREHVGNICNILVSKGFCVVCLPILTTDLLGENTSIYSSWLGDKWHEDAQQTKNIIEKNMFESDWLVVDHYGIDQRWESTLRDSVKHIMVIDDLANRNHNCDLLLDQNLVAQMETRYLYKVPNDCCKLLGPKYALLQADYAELHNAMRTRKEAIKRILIFFGGADGPNLTGRCLDAFMHLNRTDVDADIIITSNNTYKDAIYRQATGKKNIHLYENLPSIANLIYNADFAIGGGGTTNWERLCLGLPSIVITLAENQRPVAEELHRQGLINWLGHYDEVDKINLKEVIAEFLDKSMHSEWTIKCKNLLDGRGVTHVSTQMFNLYQASA